MFASPTALPRLARVDAAAGAERRRALFRVAAYAILVGLTLSPLLWAAVPALVDYPDHLARIWIITHSGDIPALAANYGVHWRVLPNLALDIVASALAQVMPVELAARVFTALTLASLVAGTMVLRRTLLGRVGLWPLASLLFLYNAALYWGLLNFLFAAGMFLLAFSGWIGSRRWPTGWRLALFAVVAAVLMVLHLFAFGMYALTVAAYELGLRLDGRRISARAARDWVIRCLHLVPATALWIASTPPGISTYTHYGTVGAKAYAAVAGMNFGFMPTTLDYLTIAFGFGFLVFALMTRSLKLAPQMRLPVRALIMAAVLMPQYLSGSWVADIRLPVIIPLVLIAATQLERPRRLVIDAFAAVALVLLGWRVWTVSHDWHAHDARMAEYRAASAAITPGARLLVVEPSLYSNPGAREQAMAATTREELYWHVPELSVLDRAAFVPYVFTGWTPVQAAPRNAALSQSAGAPLEPERLAISRTAETDSDVNPNPFGGPMYWRGWPHTFDFVLWIDFGLPQTVTIPGLEPVAAGSFFHIYRVVRPAAS